MEDNVRRFLCAGLIAAASISAAPTLAQDSYPNRPIKIVLPVPTGSALDIATRAIGEQLSVRWGQQVLVEARPGAGGLIAGQAVASAQPDGYTVSARAQFMAFQRVLAGLLALAGALAFTATCLPSATGADESHDAARIGLLGVVGLMWPMEELDSP